MALILTLTLVGTAYIIILYSKPKCSCRLCKREFTLDTCVGEGGFGSVYIVSKTLPDGTSAKYILKKLEMSDLNELEKVQYEAKQLRMMQHKYIVQYEDEFLHMVDGPIKSHYVYVIIMEYCESGDLTDLIRKSSPLP